MYLEKLEIQGFKSFANKNTLVFPGMLSKSKRGITAIVGPNGSGKSNIADAVRWALGEQSMKTLRGKKSEDIIFSGSDKKSGLGMAEVSLFLNNEDPHHGGAGEKAPIDYSQLVLTRRLYRNGDSEYLINNSRVRLADIQILLAKAKFGQKTYSVIGQGVVEGFLNTSLAERKEFFDEATGVKQFQIKRDESLNKLRMSFENLNQTQMLLNEIEPRLRSLTRQVNKLQKRGEIERELKNLQLNYYSKIWHELNDKFNYHNKQFLEKEKTKLEKEKRLVNLNRELNQLETDQQDLTQLNEWQQRLTAAQNQKDILTKQLAKIEAQLEAKLEANGQFDLSWLNNKKEELIKEIKVIEEEIAMLVKNIEPEKSKLQTLAAEKKEIDSKIDKINQKLVLTSSMIDTKTTQDIHEKLKKSLVLLEQASQEFEPEKIKTILEEIKKEIKQIIIASTKQGEEINLEKIQHELIKLTKDKEKIITNINETNLRISARSERVKLLNENKSGLQDELTTIKAKLRQYGISTDSDEAKGEQEKIKKKLADIEQEIVKIKEKITNTSLQEEVKRNRLFDLQKDMQNLQNEINQLNNQLNEIKINSTRYETKLEGLEIEIRHNFGNLKEVKEYKAEGLIDLEAAYEKITQLKRQLDLIGGIDPEIEKEYAETKERFDFLSSQVNDLTKAIDSLKEIIEELDSTIKEKFDKEFKLIQNKFEQYFKILFNGGRAKIIKVMEEVERGKDKNNSSESTREVSISRSEHRDFTNTQDNKIKQAADLKKIKFLQKHNATGLAGIEIQACPPGKKIKSISMLSGGERALTAIALICAIISANPSPFVVLDEVDAALDEANSERLAKILDDLSHKTQFIVITHNRATMRRANILYGITMGNDGVSKLLSIKLEEAEMKSGK